MSVTDLATASLSRHLLQQQASVDESDMCTAQLLHMQHRSALAAAAAAAAAAVVVVVVVVVIVVVVYYV